MGIMGTIATNLTAVQLLALAKFKPADGVREQVEPGDYDVDLILSIHGTVKVGEDYHQNIADRQPWKDLFFAALSRMDPVGAGILVDLIELGGAPTVPDSVTDYRKRLDNKTRTLCKGKVTCTLTAEGISSEVTA